MKHTKYLVIGAGITGLSFSKFIEDDYIVLEKESSVGGYCRSIVTDQYQWDYAGHFFHFRNTEMKALFFQLLNHNNIITKEKKTKIYIENQWIDYPFQNNINQLDEVSYHACLHDYNNRRTKEAYLHFEDMLYGQYGKSMTDMFLKPYNEKLYACDLKTLDDDAIGRFFPKSNFKDSIGHQQTYNNTFYYPKDGTASFIQALASSLHVKDEIRLNEEVLSVDIEKKQVHTSQERYSYDVLVNTAPFNQLLQWVNKGEYLDCFKANKVLVLNLGFDKPSVIEALHWIYVPSKNINFYRVGFYDHILDTDLMSLYVEISFKTNDVVDVNKELEETLIHLKHMKIITDHQLMDYSAVVMDPAYAHIGYESEKIKKEIIEQLKQEDVYTLGRYGRWQYNSMEDNMVDARALATKLKKQYG